MSTFHFFPLCFVAPVNLRSPRMSHFIFPCWAFSFRPSTDEMSEKARGQYRHYFEPDSTEKVSTLYGAGARETKEAQLFSRWMHCVYSQTGITPEM